ncbi:hypothetical protein AgCh_035702 [Apium graveolens]
MTRSNWLYYCPKCRFFAHFQCARSCPISSSSEDETYPNLVHLPEVDESSVNLLVQHFVKDLVYKSQGEEKGETDIEMKHFGHQHSLILNENYIAKARDTCNGCLEEIVSCKSFIYSCSSISNGSISTKTRDPFDALIRSFIDETNTSGADTDCDKFLLHKTCAELPQKIENPTSPNAFLVLFSQLATKEAHTFCYCNVCSDEMPWLYCSSDFKFRICVKCAFLQLHSLEDRQFEHAAHSKHPLALILRPSSFKCDACKVKKDLQDMSLRYSEDGKYPNLVHLPAADESSVDVLVQKFIKAMSNEYYDDKIIVSTIKHRDHPEHRLELITINELNDKKDAAAAADDDIPLSCDGCVKPIETDSNQFYEDLRKSFGKLDGYIERGAVNHATYSFVLLVEIPPIQDVMPSMVTESQETVISLSSTSSVVL